MVSVLHVDIASTESQLMRPRDLAEILGNFIVGSGVGLADDGATVAPGEAVSRDCDANHRLEQRLRLDSEISPGARIVGYLPNLGPRYGSAERAYGTRTDQVGVSQSKRIDAIVGSIAVNGQRVLSIISGRLRQFCEEETPEQRLLVALDVVQPGNTDFFILVRNLTVRHSTAWIGRNWQFGADPRRRRIEACWRDLVVHETLGRRQRDLFAGIARR